MDLDLVSLDDLIASQVPPGWFVDVIRHVHTPIKYAGDVHQPVRWQVEFQCLPKGGRLVIVTGPTLDDAIRYAAERCRELDAEIPRGRKDSL